MLKFYDVYLTVKASGHNEKTRFVGSSIEEEKEDDVEQIKVNWKNLDEILQKYGLIVPFTVWSFKHGRLISFFDSSLFHPSTWDVLEWKKPDYEMLFTLSWIEKEHYSINDIKEYGNAKIAKEFLEQL